MSKPKPPEPVVRKSVTLPESLWREVTEYRTREQIGSEMETMRQLVRSGLRCGIQSKQAERQREGE